MFKKSVFSLLVSICIITTVSYTYAVPLTPSEAFKFSLKKINSRELLASWKIAKGFHLYKQFISIKILKPSKTVLGKIILPEGIKKHNELYGDYQDYEGTLNIKIPIKKWGLGITKFEVGYQGCDKDMCYPPVTKIVSIQAPEIIKKTTVSKTTFKTPPAISDNKPKSETGLSGIQSLLAEGNIFLILGSFFLFGLLLSLTPCVLPMIPILVGIIMGQENINGFKAFLLSLIYVLGMAVTYAIAGVITASLGNSVQAILQNIWVITACAILFVLLSLSLFGFYELQMPSSISNRLNKTANKTKGGTYVGVFIMGVISSLVVSPCVSAPLVGTLIYIASTGDIILGGSVLFVLALGMGVLLIIVGTTGGKLFLKAGSWMLIVKYILGILMLAVAIWLMSRVLPESWINLMWGMLIIGIALYMGAIEPVKTGRWSFIKKMIAFFILIAGIGIMLSFFLSFYSFNKVGQNGNMSDNSVSKITSSDNHKDIFKKVTTLQQLNKQLEIARTKNKPVMIDYWAEWCTDCKEMDITTFANPEVIKELKSFITIKADITKNNADTVALKKKYGVFGPPFFIFLTPEGKVIKNSSIAGHIGAGAMVKHLTNILDNLKSIKETSAKNKIEWLTNFETAKVESKKKNLPILALFTGEPWCINCKDLKDNILVTDKFIDYANKYYVLFQANFPEDAVLEPKYSNYKQSDAIKKQNANLKFKYGIIGFPTVLILNNKGKVVNTAFYENNMSVSEFIEEVKNRQVKKGINSNKNNLPKDNIELLSISPKPNTILKVGEKVNFKVKIKYCLESKNSGILGITVQNYKKQFFRDINKTIQKGIGEVTLSLEVEIPDVKMIKVYLSLTPKGKEITNLVTSQSYDVN